MSNEKHNLPAGTAISHKKSEFEGGILDAADSKSKRSLRRALWINTWALLSLAIAQQKIDVCTAAATTRHAVVEDQVPLAVGSKESMELEEYRDGKDWLPKPDEPQHDSVIVVATVDGTLAGLSRKTGKTLWKQKRRDHNISDDDTTGESGEAGGAEQHNNMRPQSDWDRKARPDDAQPDGNNLLSPLVSTTTTAKTSSDWKTAAVPSVDGRVYLTRGRGEASGTSGDKTDLAASTTVRELVNRAPFVDSRGRFYVGSRHSTAAALDQDTGEVLLVVSAEKQEDLAHQQETMKGRNVVWLGRVDYSVSLYDARTGQSDVNFSAAEVMGLNDMVAASQSDWNVDSVSHSQRHAPRLLLPNGHADDLFRPTKSSLLVATPNGNVALRNPETGKIQWVAEEAFDTPVTFAVDSSSGVSLGVDIFPDATVPSDSAEYLSKELERQIDAYLNQPEENSEQTIVGALSSGDLFAMPLGGTSSIQTKQHTHTLSLPHPHSVASSSSAVGSGKHISSIAPVAGKHTSSHVNDVSLHHSHRAVDKRKRNCNPSSPSFPSCLVGPSHSGNPRPFFHQHETALEESSALTVKQDGALMMQYHPHLGYLAQPEDVHDLLKRRKSLTFDKIMGSWLPSTMVLIFVLSFLLGKQLRQKRVEATQTAAKGAAVDEDASSEIVPRDESNASLRNVGVIQVSDEVLGYGGHGTVVYKGMLDGRKVAVKRMLKTYLASADREISLLIESDGHPNVVRYFLKEVRGDFVYLALELCDMSLHNLIGSLATHVTRPELNGMFRQSHVPASIKLTLHQIASGVRHLHSLRIVHRDLKPANILLARKNQKRSKSLKAEDDESDYAAFERGDFIAKISDMGLGKQLAGQSSFGTSTMGNASLTSHPNGPSEGSTLFGAGPGSVGWQAPEVMALRWSPESTANRSDVGSQGGSDSLTDASPLDAVANTRTSRSADIFSLGCIFYCTLVPGSHPFGDWYEREANIMKNKPCIEELEKLSPDAYDLVSSMIQRDPKARPTAKQICRHPFFWSAHERLGFLCDVSDRLESGPDSDTSSDAQQAAPLPLSSNSLAIERNAARVVGIAWDKDLDEDLINNVSRFRTYDPSSVRDCLRLVRNKHHHFDELPNEVKDRIGCNLDGLLDYFEVRFPRLLMHCYQLCRELMTESDPIVEKYCIPTYARLVANRLHSQEPIVEENRAESNVTVPEEPHARPTLIVEESCEESTHGSLAPSLQERNGPVSNVTGPAEVAVKTDDNNSGLIAGGTAPSTTPMDGDEISNGLARTSDVATAKATSATIISKESDVLSDALTHETVMGTDNRNDIKSDPEAVISTATSMKDSDAPTALVATATDMATEDIVIWEGSTAAKQYNCRGWSRSDDAWIRRTGATLRKRDNNIVRCAEDPKFRTRLCNHWDASLGTFCPMRRKNKCVFAHGPVELRVKEGKRNRWGKLVDKNGNNANPRHSGGEDTYGAARSIETVRKEEGKWKTDKASRGKSKGK